MYCRSRQVSRLSQVYAYCYSAIRRTLPDSNRFVQDFSECSPTERAGLLKEVLAPSMADSRKSMTSLRHVECQSLHWAASPYATLSICRFATVRSQIAGSGVLQDLFEGIQGNIDILPGLKSGDSRLYQKEVHVLSPQLAISQPLLVPCSGASHVPRPLEPPKQWIWSAMDAKTRQVVALHVGDRSRQSAKQL